MCGPDCSSWTVVSRGSSGRTVLNPGGYHGNQWVADNNVTVSRRLGFSRPSYTSAGYKDPASSYPQILHILGLHLLDLGFRWPALVNGFEIRD